ncbi:MAG: 2,3-diaminopropionate biosynthesis protein SbnB [Candidatus Andersenbacteria bacterium]|nr:2,3-diaminopropionate biosynthesis protein SbnB [Candidatus Andersenbacteria bacterium]
MALVKQAVLEALRVHYEATYVQPPKVYLQEGPRAHTADRIIAMPVYVKSYAPVSGLKWIGSKHTNPQRGLNRASALIVLNDQTTNAPMALLDGTLISAMRTTAVSLIAIDRLRPSFRTAAILGMGRLGKMHAEILVKEYHSVQEIRCFSQHALFDDLMNQIPQIVRCSTFEDALKGADVVVTTTTANSPYIEPHHVPGDPLLINLSLMDFTIPIFTDSDIIVDDWRQCRLAKKVLKEAIDQGLVLQADAHELSEVLYGAMKHKQFPGRTIVNPLGMALEDIIVAWEVYQQVKDDPSLPLFEIE